MKVTLYTTHCPKCEILTSKLQDKNICFSIVEDEKIMLDKGFEFMPMLEVDDKTMDFNTANKWINNLEG